MSNLSIWNELSPVDPKACREFKRGGFTGTAINPAWILKRLTDVFGPVGKGWGFDVEDETYTFGHRLDSYGSSVLVHVVRGRLWYMIEGEKCYTIPQYGQTTMVGENRNGIYTDEEAPKKSITDCIGKCASSLGLAADIYLDSVGNGGLWDGNKYVNSLDAELPAPKGPTRRASATAKTATEPAEESPKRRRGRPRKEESAPPAPKDKAELPATEPPFESTGGDPLHGLDGWAYWNADQWQDHLEEADPDPATLLKLFAAVAHNGFDEEGAEEHERICAVFSDVFRVVCEGPSEERKKLLALFKSERKKLDKALDK